LDFLVIRGNGDWSFRHFNDEEGYESIVKLSFAPAYVQTLKFNQMPDHDHDNPNVHPYHVPNQIILDTLTPLQGIPDLGSSVGLAADDRNGPALIELMKDSLTLKLLLPLVQDHLKMERELEAEDVKKLRISPYNQSLWEITFYEDLAHLSPHFSTSVLGEDRRPGAEDNHTHTETLPGLNVHLHRQTYETDDIHLTAVPLENFTPMAVGIVDKGDFSDADTHVSLMRKIIRHPESVEAVAIPMVNKPEQDATLFDLISALYNKNAIDGVQVINISQGFYSNHSHPILEKALRQVAKPIVCSAGNSDTDDSEMQHWPSHYCNTIPNVISVGYLEKKTLGYRPASHSNKGAKGVTLFAKGKWTEDLQGTSLAAAWVSRLIALNFAKNRKVKFEMKSFAREIKDLAGIEIKETNKTESSTGYRIFPSS